MITSRIGSELLRRAMLMSAVAFVMATGGSPALSSEHNCRRLEALARQYAGVQLTTQQQQLKRRLVTWYNGNCTRTRSAQR